MSCSWIPPEERRRAVEWVAANHDALPRTLAELSRFPMFYRTLIVGALPGDARLSLWREHLMAQVGDDSALDAAQQAFVRETCDVLPELFAERAPNPRIVAWEARMATIFERRQAAAIFAALGPPEPPGGLPVPAP
jgi:hypothetical protein